MRLQYAVISVCVVVGAACTGPELRSAEPTVATTEANANQLAATSPVASSGAVVVQEASTAKRVHEIVYTDLTGTERTVVVEVRQPTASQSKRPVIVWSHGGSTGKTTPTRVGNEWGKAMNRSDFVFVAVAHAGRTEASRLALCKELDVEVCEEFQYLLWDRLRDVQTVFDWLERSAAAGELSVDLGRLVYGGHSAGALAVMVMAGMDSPYVTGVPMPIDDRPAAFLVASPPGAQKNEFDASSLAGLNRPMLMLTGEGDTTRGNFGADRLALFDLIVSDQVMLVSTESDLVGHTTFNLQTQPCMRAGGSQAHCREMVQAFGHTAQAFLRSSLGADGLDPERLIDEGASRLPAHISLRSTIDP